MLIKNDRIWTFIIFSSACFLCNCSFFNMKNYTVVSTDAKVVAAYNLLVMRYCNLSNTNYLYVNKDHCAKAADLFIYINDINEDLEKSKLCFKTLQNYNQSVIDEVAKK